jgi:hypothetical protein
MAYTPPEELPEDWDTLERALARVYLEGKEAGKKELRESIRKFLMTKFFGAKGKKRRANPEDPKIQAIREIMETMYEKFEDGTL